MAVLDIRGTHGSGKSFILSRLLKLYEWESFVGPGQATKNGPLKDRHLGYVCEELDAFIVGSYDVKSGFGGGCDLLFPDEVEKRVKTFNDRHRCVILEGLLVSHTFERYKNLALEVPGYVFCFLDTPISVCEERVQARRETMVSTNVKTAAYNPRAVTKEFRSIASVQRKCRRTPGIEVRTIPYRNALSTVRRWIKEA
jgi:hypothetical protein